MWEVTDPEATTITVHNLTPFMEYALRLVANNVVGPSPPSEPTKNFQTIQAPPSHAPYNVTVRAVSATQLRVRWTVSSIISQVFIMTVIIIILSYLCAAVAAHRVVRSAQGL